MANFVFGPSPNSAWKRPKFVSHAGHSVARQLFDEMSQRVTRVQCVSTMQEHRVPSSLLHTDACSYPPEWMASSPLLPGVLSRPQTLLLALYRRDDAAASTMAAGALLCALLLSAGATAPHRAAAASTARTWPGRGQAFPSSNSRPAEVVLLRLRLHLCSV